MKHNNQPAFDDLYREYFNDLYRFIYTLVGNAEEALDTTQETFIKLYPLLEAGEEIRNPKAWIYRVAANICYNYLNLHPSKSTPPIMYQTNSRKVPGSFLEQFDVDEELKKFLLDFRYILFDTNPWDFRDESNRELRDNVMLFTALVLMKAALTNDKQAILEIFHFWHEKGFIEKNKEMVLFFMGYIFHTHKIKLVKLTKMLEESKIYGGEIMETLAQQLKKEGKKEGKKEALKETAKRMLLNDYPLEEVINITGLTEKEVKKLMN